MSNKCHRPEHTHIRLGFKHNNSKKNTFQASWFTIMKEYWGVYFDKETASYVPTVTYARVLFDFWPTRKSWAHKHNLHSNAVYPYGKNVDEAGRFGSSGSLEWDSARAAARRMVGEFNIWYQGEYGKNPPESFWEVAEKQAPD